jgi:osmotically-inducible protein OsmY
MKREALYPLACAAAVAAMFVAVTPVRASETDDRIESSFKNSYVYKTYLKDDAVKAEAKDGVVTLTGTVAEESHKALAQDTVTSLPGVTRVDNKLATKAEVAAESADTWIGRKVKLALLYHRNVSGINTTVEVKDGIVTLKGEASSMAQKELAAEYAKDIEGVKEVKNEMTVAATPEMAERTAGEKLDDASITAQVKTALSTHRSTSAVKTKVETRDGEVTLTGIAKNAAEKSLVTKLVTDIQGVTSVKNQMTVEEVKTK